MNASSNYRELYRAGQRAWPALSLDESAFERHCQRVLTPGDDVPLEPGSLYLCCACAEGDSAALRVFQREVAAVAEAALRRVDAREDQVREGLQEVWRKLLLGPDAKVKSYSGRGPLQAWVRVAATRVALDRRRAGQRNDARRAELSERLAAADPNVEATLLRARFGEAFQAALSAAVSGLSAQQRNVLRMHTVGGASIDEIGRAYRVHRATAARWLERARGRIYEQVRAELCLEQRLTHSEFDSLAQLIGAELSLSLTAIEAAPSHAEAAGETEAPL